MGDFVPALEALQTMIEEKLGGGKLTEATFEECILDLKELIRQKGPGADLISETPRVVEKVHKGTGVKVTVADIWKRVRCSFGHVFDLVATTTFEQCEVEQELVANYNTCRESVNSQISADRQKLGENANAFFEEVLTIN